MKKQRLADLVLLAIALIWGTTFLLVQNAIAALPPYSFLFVRFLWAALFLLGIYVWQRRSGKQHDGRSVTLGTWIAGTILAITLFMGYAFQTIGLLYTTSSKAGFITGLNVVLVPIFSLFLLRLKPSAMAIVGVVLASAGLFFLAFGDQLSSGGIAEGLVLNTGDLLIFFCTIGFALQIIFTGKYARLHNVLLLTIIQLGVVALLSFVFALFTEDLTPLFSLSTYTQPTVFFALVITAFFATALAFLGQTHFQQHTTPTRVALIYAMEPIFAALAGVFFGAEILTALMLVGGGLIFLGMILAELPTDALYRLFKLKRRAQS